MRSLSKGIAMNGVSRSLYMVILRSTFVLIGKLHSTHGSEWPGRVYVSGSKKEKYGGPV